MIRGKLFPDRYLHPIQLAPYTACHEVVPRQVFTPYSRLFISTAFVVVSGVGWCDTICIRETVGYLELIVSSNMTRKKKEKDQPGHIRARVLLECVFCEFWKTAVLNYDLTGISLLIII